MLSETVMIGDDDDDDDDDTILTKVLDSCSVTEDKYIQGLETMGRKISIIYKGKLNETIILCYLI